MRFRRQRANPIPRPIRGARNAAQRIYATHAGVEQLRAEVARLSEAVDGLSVQLGGRPAQSDVDRLGQEIAALSARIGAVPEQTDARREGLFGELRRNHAESLEILQLLRDDEPANRQRLWRLRETPEYLLAFEEPEPLVSFAIATYTNTEALLERSLPSVLAQTYERIEVVVVGDGAAPEVERAVKSVGDPRIRYYNLPMRGPYPERAELRWHVAGGPPSNEAMRLSRGRWIAGMDDDDVSSPDRVAVLLEAARKRDLELCYGQIRMRHLDGSTQLVCDFPPAVQKVGLQASLMHAGMKFICAELGDALFSIPGDWSRVRRMIRIGVRTGMIDDVVLEYFPSGFYGRQGGPDL